MKHTQKKKNFLLAALLLVSLVVTLFSNGLTANAASREYVAEKNGKYYYYVNGKVATDRSGLYLTTSQGWYYIKKGQVVNGPTVASNKYGTWYIDKKGHVDFSKTDVIQSIYDKKWYNIVKGKLTVGPTVAKNPYGSWYIDSNGKVDFSKTDVIQSIYDKKWYNIVKGKLTVGPTVAKNPYGSWYIDSNGKVDFSKTDVIQSIYDKKWYNVVKGKLTVGPTLAKNSHGLWYIDRYGKVDFGYNNSNYSFNGKKYTIVKGKATLKVETKSAIARPSTTGSLKVTGSKLTDKKGNPVQLWGLSTHGLAWFPQYINQSLFNEFSKNWNSNVIRVAMYTSEYAGYCSGGNKEDLKKKIDNAVQYAKKADMYVIIDWHVLNDDKSSTENFFHTTEAKKFFQEISKKYANYDNVIYEICNEPNGNITWNQIKQYANAVIPVIRKNDPDSVIIVGTTTWSQDVDKIIKDRLSYQNVMYTFHFYAATHQNDLRERVKKAINAGLPIFVTEFGLCEASGNGSVNEYQAKEWLNLFDKNKISYVAWNISNKAESSSIISSGCNKTSGISYNELSASGKFLYNWYRAKK